MKMDIYNPFSYNTLYMYMYKTFYNQFNRYAKFSVDLNGKV